MDFFGLVLEFFTTSLDVLARAFNGVAGGQGESGQQAEQQSIALYHFRFSIMGHKKHPGENAPDT